MMITLYKAEDSGDIYYFCLSTRQDHESRFHFCINWGFTLKNGRQKTFTYDSRDEMNRKMKLFITAKMKDGYKILYSFFRKDEYQHFQKVLSEPIVA